VTAHTVEDARRLLAVVDAGLVSGVGKPVPGQMCVEAAVCYTLGEAHGDEPSCVAPAVRAFKIRLNDSRWSSPKARAVGLRAVAVAQLGSREIVDGRRFAARVAELTIREVLPPALVAVGLHKEAERCALEGSYAAASAAAAAAADATASAAAASAAAAAAADATASAAAASAAAASAADYAAAAANYAAAGTPSAADKILTLSADICLGVLRECGSPGVALWDAIQAEEKR